MKHSLTTILALAAGFFAALYFFSPRTVKEKPVLTTVTNTVERWMTNEVEVWSTNEVELWRTNEVVREVQVPAKLTPEQQFAVDFLARTAFAPTLSGEEVFYKVASFNVQAAIDAAVERAVSADEIKTKFELTLRSHGLRIDTDSQRRINLNISAFWDDLGTLLTYSTVITLMEPVNVMRQGEVWKVWAITWTYGSFGHAGKSKAKEALLDLPREHAEKFVNNYLKAKEHQAAIGARLLTTTEHTPLAEPDIRTFTK